MKYSDWKEKFVTEPAENTGKPAENIAKGGIIETVSTINSPIEFGHPVDVAFGGKELSERQQRILDQLPGYGSQAVVKKRDVSMLDLSALTAKTGDEFAMFTRKGKRLIVRGNAKQVPLYENDLKKLFNDGYRWSGHTHTGFTGADLIASQGDKDTLVVFRQDNSVIYNAMGKQGLIYPKKEKT